MQAPIDTILGSEVPFGLFLSALVGLAFGLFLSALVGLLVVLYQLPHVIVAK
jgi:ribose/xylose/arabinose/galactoside ABC-type transport system permease subunit